MNVFSSTDSLSAASGAVLPPATAAQQPSDLTEWESNQVIIPMSWGIWLQNSNWYLCPTLLSLMLWYMGLSLKTT